MIHMTLDCVIPTQFSVIQTFHCNVDLKCFFSFLPKCLFVIIVMYAYVINIWQGSVGRGLFGLIYGVVGYIIITLLQTVRKVCQWKNFENRSIIILAKMGQKYIVTFFGPPCIFRWIVITSHRLQRL